MRINHNMAAINAHNQLTKNGGASSKSLEKLSSGLRINSAGDDAAGLAISEKMRTQIRGLDKAQANAQDGISLIQTAEGALQQTTDILQRMRELVIKSENDGVLSPDDKAAIDTEFTELSTEIDRIAKSTSFNGKTLLDGESGELKFKIGANTLGEDTLVLEIEAMTTTGIGINNTTVGSAKALDSIDSAIKIVSEQRAKLGAVQNRMEYAIESIKVTGENLTSAESRIRDVDMASEMVNFTKNNILQQSAMSMLAQANQQPMQILSLLQ